MSESELLKQKLLDTVDLMEFGIELMRQNIARRLPKGTSSEHVERELRRWLFEQPVNFSPQAEKKEAE